MNKKKIIFIQIIFSVALIFALLFTKDEIKKNEPLSKLSITTDEISNKFYQSMLEFNLDSSFIRKKRTKNINLPEFRVAVPVELPIPILIQNLTSTFLNYDVQISAEERRLNRAATFMLQRENKNIFVVDFVSDTNAIRRIGNLSLIISGLTPTNFDEFKEILIYPEHLTFMINPLKNSEQLSKKILANRKNFLVELIEDTDELALKLSPEYSNNRLRISVRTIVGTFPDENIFYINKSGELYQSPVFPFIQSEFDRRKIMISDINKIQRISSEANIELAKYFDEKINSIAPNDVAVLMIDINNFENIIEILKAKKRKGMKILPFNQAFIE